MHARLALLASSLVLTSVAACKNNPVEGKPMATTQEPVNPAPALPGAQLMQLKRPVLAEALFARESLAITPANSKVSFVGAKVTGKHLGTLSNVTGMLLLQQNLEHSKLSIEIDVASLKSDGGDKLDGHLKSADFFDVAKFPKASFVSDSFVKGADGNYTVTGTMEIHGVRKTLTFPATSSLTPQSLTLKSEFGISRKDFGVVYPGQPNNLIKDEILLTIELNLARSPK